jgi:23S rRNA (guanosine2251-2'-O)-methyltransferase
MEKKDFIYGRNPIIEHLEGGGSFEQILIQKGIDREVSGRIMDLAKSMRLPVQIVPHHRMDRVTRKNHQGVIAFTAWVVYDDLSVIVQDCFERGDVPLVLILDRITDVRNMGAIARSAEIFGATAIVLPMKESAMVNADAVKTSAGAILHVKMCREKSLAHAVRLLHDMGLKICVADQGAKDMPEDVDFSGPTAIIMGSERLGVDSSLRSKADTTFAIPQIGKTESLNVSVATGVILYEVTRQRTRKEKK